MNTQTNQEDMLDKDTLLSLYRQMVLIRSFEEQVMDLYTRTLIPGIAHVSIGQEAVAVGVCANLHIDDYITSTHRGHGHCIAKGAQPNRMFAELFGKTDGYCRGKGGSMHIADPDTGNLGANAIVGGSIALATGAALSAKRRKEGQVVVCFFGDGALNQGVLLESMNMASIWQLPVIFVCENNQYGEYTPTDQVTAGNIQMRGEAMGIDSVTTNGMDVVGVYKTMSKLVSNARQHGSPGFLICQTYRYYGHGMSDRDRAYRTRDEEKEWRQEDPIERLTQHLFANEYVSQTELDVIAEDTMREISAAVDYGKQAPFPEPDEVMLHVYPD